MMLVSRASPLRPPQSDGIPPEQPHQPGIRNESSLLYGSWPLLALEGGAPPAQSNPEIISEKPATGVPVGLNYQCAPGTRAAHTGQARRAVRSLGGPLDAR